MKGLNSVVIWTQLLSIVTTSFKEVIKSSVFGFSEYLLINPSQIV